MNNFWKVIMSFAIVLIAAVIVTSCQSSVEANNNLKTEDQQVSSAALKAANVFIGSLNDDLKSKLLFDFKEDERFNWYYIPIERKGLSFELLNADQRKKGDALLKACLSDQGMSKTKEIMSLELVLREVENRPPNDRRRNPENYYFSIFGTPSASTPWGWRFEGHHLSLNFSSITGKIDGATPSFMGSNPAIVLAGTYKDKEVLKKEQQLGKQLYNALSESQKKTATLDMEWGDILTKNDKRVTLDKLEGLKVSEFNKDQRKIFDDLLDVYLGNLEKSITLDYKQRIDDNGGIGSMYFAWAGSPTEGKHYYRIHGATLLIEYDNSQNDANHIHSVLRDVQNDFGEDLLKRHYETSKHD
ncbi:MAG: DUF3500 domain-containing protein [Bacteroidetes bacterium]|nr:DUF3500 domain-containing protein [Bacteroidota bacterium]MDA1121495.1 DUF3500 domain-containing protein [Bacteroidota bacterium]